MTSDNPEPVSPKEFSAAARSPATTGPPPHQPCPACAGASGAAPGGANSRFVYALGRIEPRYPSITTEKEFAQAIGRAETANLTDRQAIREVLRPRENRYLARQLCWVLTIEGLDIFLLQPRDPADFELLIEALRPTPSPLDLDLVVGTRGPIALPEMCNGLMVPIVTFDQLYSFDRDSLIRSIPAPAGKDPREFATAAEELLNRMMQMADNTGATDEHRALNYLAVRAPAIYTRAAEEFQQDSSLTRIEVRRSPLSSTRNVMDVIFSYTNRKTDVTEKFFVRVDVTEEFPFLVTKLSPYYDR
jgi:hypothetical protein